MPEEQELQNTQETTGNQEVEGEGHLSQPEASTEPEVAAQQEQKEETPEPKGGPSDEWKAKRLEQENKTIKERLEKMENHLKKQEDSNIPLEDRFAKEQEQFYREKASHQVLSELKDELGKIPEALAERIKQDPFNEAWLDRKTLEYELLGVNRKSPKERYEAAVIAAKKSLPEFIAGITPQPAQTEANKEETSKGTVGNNPPIEQNNQFGGRDLWQVPTEELKAMLQKKPIN